MPSHQCAIPQSSEGRGDGLQRRAGLASARYSGAALPRVASAPDPLGNLPAQFTSFVGRELEVGQVLELVRRRDVRLVTLTGPGGVGKTRVAIKTAECLAEDFDDGIFFVSLAPITDAALVTSAIADVLDVQEVSSVPLLRTLQAYLRDRRLLLLSWTILSTSLRPPRQLPTCLSRAPGCKCW